MTYYETIFTITFLQLTLQSWCGSPISFKQIKILQEYAVKSLKYDFFGKKILIFNTSYSDKQTLK